LEVQMSDLSRLAGQMRDDIRVNGCVWQPIETAPKAGRFLVGGPTITGRYPPWHIEIVKYRDSAGTPISADDAFQVTHWMPFAAPPPRQENDDVYPSFRGNNEA